MRGSRSALLIGTGSGAPGLADLIHTLNGNRPLDIVLMSRDPDQWGGLPQLGARRIYSVEKDLVRSGPRKPLHEGDIIDLGVDQAGKKLQLEVRLLREGLDRAVTLLDINDRLLFAGSALGTQGSDNGLVLRESPAPYHAALSSWRQVTDGRYDMIYTGHNFQWATRPAYVDQLIQALGCAESSVSSIATSETIPKTFHSAGPADIAASITLQN